MILVMTSTEDRPADRQAQVAGELPVTPPPPFKLVDVSDTNTLETEADASSVPARTPEAGGDLAELVRELEGRLANSLPLPTGDDDAIARERLLTALGRPTTAAEYEIAPSSELVALDPMLNERLHAAGFTNTQAQLVYDLASEVLAPMVGNMAAEFRAEREVARLQAHLGGAQQWNSIAEQLRTWGQANLDPATFNALSCSYEGVLAMMEIMRTREPQLVVTGEPSLEALDQTALDAMIRDPRYWRSRDPEFVARVTAGFERLFSR